MVKVVKNTFYKYEYKYKICLSYMIQTDLSKEVWEILLDTLKATCEEVHV